MHFTFEFQAHDNCWKQGSLLMFWQRLVLKQPVHIVCSPYKTASSSIEQALLDMNVGKKAMPHNGDLLRETKQLRYRWRKVANQSTSFKAFARQNAKQIRSDFLNYVKEIQEFDVFADAPFGHTHTHSFVRKILAPKAVHIWINRDFDEWADSVKRWEYARPNIYANGIEAWETRPEFRLKQLGKLWNSNYRQFKRLCEAFPKDCLELDFDELNGYSALASYYHVKVPESPFPVRNVNETTVLGR